MKMHKTHEPHHGGDPDRGARRTNHSLRFLEDLDLPQNDELHRPPPIDHVERLERGVEHQDAFEDLHSFAVETQTRCDDFTPEYTATRAGLQSPSTLPVPFAVRGAAREKRA